jgi:hypothetical protein
MMKARFAAALLMLVLGAAMPRPAQANLFIEMSFKEKVAESDVVIVGTIDSTTPGHPSQYDASATVSVLYTLKGAPPLRLVVLTKSRIQEESPQCCARGATYVMFLKRTSDGLQLRSVNGRFGMIRIGPERSDPQIEVLKR